VLDELAAFELAVATFRTADFRGGHAAKRTSLL
jgi:hypothetical protein